VTGRFWGSGKVVSNARHYWITGTTEELFIPISVTVELEWVLRSRYGLDKSDIIEVFALLESGDVEFQTEATVEVAINLYHDYNVDFADCLHHIATAFTENGWPNRRIDVPIDCEWRALR